MTKDEAKAFLDKIGVKVDENTDDIVAKVDEWKSGLDAETRRAVRPYWIYFNPFKGSGREEA